MRRDVAGELFDAIAHSRAFARDLTDLAVMATTMERNDPNGSDLLSAIKSQLPLSAYLCEDFAFLTRASKVFAFEFDHLGMPAEEVHRQLIVAKALLSRLRVPTLGIALIQFPDVQPNWAAEAVKEDRALGLISGYPDGKFHG